MIWNDDENDSGSPADRSNLRESDCVVRINGRNVSRSTAESVAKIIKYVCWVNEMIEEGIQGVSDGASIIVKFNLHRAYPSLHPFGVVHWVPALSNIKTATGCESNRQLQLWTVFAGTVVNNYQFNGIQGWAGQLCQISCRAVI